MAKAAKRQHYIARFYLRNFAVPVLSENLCVYDMRKQRWDKRTPDGVGWFPHLYSTLDAKGHRTDDFDQYMKLNVEDPAAPVLRKLATGGTADVSERPALALFIAITAARSPETINDVLTQHIGNLTPTDLDAMDRLLKLWCGWTGRPHDARSRKEFLKPSCFGAIWMWSLSFARCLLELEWHYLHTTRDQPFVTSDRPVFAEWDRVRDMRLVSFPLSSEKALIVIAGGRFNDAHDQANDVAVINRQTIHRAREFVVSCKEMVFDETLQMRRCQP